ncbi:MAG TPA: glycosyltransferase [Phenylobacterium sp.]|uniref:glycosyltransferase family 2 protein n=1 Tax=Phenylobacterium sp. TaxID=1871053 RepID=UPI002B77E4E4|nr:glycosyltransferase [Phenylobacterium sp.]HXA38381.1 glycosyltransferase [Phenylobacterium sp.]
MQQPIVKQGRGGRPKVTVMIITYNHAKYLAQAIESVLAQKTDFTFAIHVIDDCSTDGAQDIVRDYAARYPGVVKPFINKKNIGNKVTQKNFYRGFCTLDGDYIAFLEGDDYWASPDRLQAHVAFLDANPDFVACANNTIKVYEDGSKEPHLFMEPYLKDAHEIGELIMLSSFFHASSLTFRNVFRGKVPRYLRSPLSCDIFITIAHAQHGKIRFFPEPWSVYRAHAGGLFSNMSETKGWMWNIDSLRACNRWLRYRYVPQFTKSIYHYCDRLLLNGREEDGFTPEKRRYYEGVRRRYRIWEKAYRWMDVWLAKWIPGRRARTSGATLNLGAGLRGWVPYVNVDIRRDVDADMVVDLEHTPWPWPDNYAKEVKFERSLEHMGGDLKTFQGMMRELYRVCQPGAKIKIVAKHPQHNAFLYDPTCVRVVSPILLGLFDGLAPSPADPQPLARRNKVDFEIIERTVILDEPYKSQFQSGMLSPESAGRLAETTLNVCSEFQIELLVHKPARGAPAVPGRTPAPI